MVLWLTHIFFYISLVIICVCVCGLLHGIKFKCVVVYVSCVMGDD